MKHAKFLQPPILSALRIILAVLACSMLYAGCGRQNVENEMAYRKAGLELLESGDYEGAVDAFEQALREHTGKVTNLEEDINFYKAYAQIEAGRTQDAVDTYTALIEYDKKNAQAYYLRGCAYISMGDAGAAAEDFKQAADCDSKDGEMYAGIYEKLTAAGMLDEASAYLEQGLAVKGSSASAYLSRGRLYLASGAYEQAEAELKIALEKKEPSANLYLGDAAKALGNSEEAVSYYQAYAKEHPDDTKAQYALGKLKFEEGAYEEAVSYFNQGLSSGSITDKRILWSGKISALEHMGDFAGAKWEMEAYLKSFPGDEQAQREYIFLKTR